VLSDVVRFESFEAFVAEPPPQGLGVDIDTLKKLCLDDPVMVDIIDRETQRPAGGDPRTNGVIHPIGEGTRDRSTKHLRRLRKDFGDLHEAVMEGEASVTGAAIEAGIYPKRVSINLGSADSAAQTILRHADASFVAALGRLLQEGAP
jgi:hypothetical protein